MKQMIFQKITDKGYKVTKYDDNSWACSCPAWIYHRGGRIDCKHITEIKEGQIVIQGIERGEEKNEKEGQ